MNFKTFAAILCILLIAGIASAAYATFAHSAFKIGDKKDINLMGQAVGNGTTKDLYCSSNCTGNFNTVSTETDASNLTIGTVADARIAATLTGKNLTGKSIGGVIYADQYATLQDAVNFSNSTALHPEVYIPAGRYGLTSPLLLPSNITVRGAGRGATILYAINSTEWYDSSVNEHGVIENWNECIVGSLGNKNIQIFDLTIDGNVSSINPLKVTNKNPLIGIKLCWVSNSIVRNVEVHNVASFGIGIWGINIAPTVEPRSIITQNYIWNITYNENATDGRLSRGIFSSNGINSGVIISNNIIHNVSTGIELEDGALENIISNNYITDCVGGNTQNTNTGMGINSANGGYSTIIEGNIITKCFNGIYWDEGLKSIITGNVVTLNRKYGIVVGSNGGNPIITDNQISKNNASGIRVLAGTTLFTIANNQLDDNGLNASESVWDRSGIYLNATDGKIVGNNIFDLSGTLNMSYAISSGSGTGLLITNNRIIPGHLINGTINVAAGNMVHDNPGIPPSFYGTHAVPPAPTGNGDTYFDTDLDKFCYYKGVWTQMDNSTAVCT